MRQVSVTHCHILCAQNSVCVRIVRIANALAALHRRSCPQRPHNTLLNVNRVCFLDVRHTRTLPRATLLPACDAAAAAEISLQRGFIPVADSRRFIDSNTAPLFSSSASTGASDVSSRLRTCLRRSHRHFASRSTACIASL